MREISRKLQHYTKAYTLTVNCCSSTSRLDQVRQCFPVLFITLENKLKNVLSRSSVAKVSTEGCLHSVEGRHGANVINRASTAD